LSEVIHAWVVYIKLARFDKISTFFSSKRMEHATLRMRICVTTLFSFIVIVIYGWVSDNIICLVLQKQYWIKFWGMIGQWCCDNNITLLLVNKLIKYQFKNFDALRLKILFVILIRVVNWKQNIKRIVHKWCQAI